ncbi:NlpC/P60 family protein [Olleya sp. Ti.3.14]|uniref:NlpC/P60 family protein n=1 Tax=Olleya sp. Ti.3.14 TaxID=3121297 RepID=UPI00311D8878
MNRLQFSCLIAFLGFISLATSQNFNFESLVVEKDSHVPVDNATVTIENTDLIVKTNSDGNFKFTRSIPIGDHVVTVTKEGFETIYFLIKSEENKQILIDKVELEITKEEAKKRNRQAKIDYKIAKELERERKAKEKLLAKKERKLQKKNSVEVVYYDTTKLLPAAKPAEEDVVTISEAQIKYAKILDVPVEQLTNKALYQFIDEWEGTPYLLGGETKDGIDCSSFTQLLNVKAFDRYIERTAEKQYESKNTDKFTGKEYLKEGDLIFFVGLGTDSDDIAPTISHVGVYLHNNKFVHATSSSRTEGKSGVKISDLTDKYWKIRYYESGRRINN